MSNSPCSYLPWWSAPRTPARCCAQRQTFGRTARRGTPPGTRATSWLLMMTSRRSTSRLRSAVGSSASAARWSGGGARCCRRGSGGPPGRPWPCIRAGSAAAARSPVRWLNENRKENSSEATEVVEHFELSDGQSLIRDERGVRIAKIDEGDD